MRRWWVVPKLVSNAAFSGRPISIRSRVCNFRSLILEARCYVKQMSCKYEPEKTKGGERKYGRLKFAPNSVPAAHPRKKRVGKDNNRADRSHNADDLNNLDPGNA